MNRKRDLLLIGETYSRMSSDVAVSRSMFIELAVCYFNKLDKEYAGDPFMDDRNISTRSGEIKKVSEVIMSTLGDAGLFLELLREVKKNMAPSGVALVITAIDKTPQLKNFYLKSVMPSLSNKQDMGDNTGIPGLGKPVSGKYPPNKLEPADIHGIPILGKRVSGKYPPNKLEPADIHGIGIVK